MATITSAQSGLWSATSTWVGGACPVDNDTVVIAAGHSVLLDVDMSGWANGLAGLTVQGSADTPGMLYCYNGYSGYLKIKTGNTIAGTSGTNKGRILVNSDGVWGNTGVFAYANKFVIYLAGTASINATYLAINTYHAEPTNKVVTPYYDKYAISSINLTTGQITMDASHGWAANRTVKLRVNGAGSLPAGLDADTEYYVISPSGETLYLAKTSGGVAVVPTDSGSGTIEIYSGYNTYSGVKTLNIFEDVTGDASWSITAPYNYAVLVNEHNFSRGYYQLRTTITDITSSTITLNDALGEAIFAGSKIYLASRNVQILSSTTSTNTNIISSATGCNFGLAIIAVSGSGTTFYGRGLNSSYNNTVSGTISGCYYGLNSSYNNTVSGTISGCNYSLLYSYANTVSGIISGCNYGLGYSYNNQISGTISGCNYGLYYSYNNPVSGIISGCNCSLYYSYNNPVSGIISGCNYGLNSSYNNTVSGTISGCNYGLYSSYNNTVSGIISGCYYGLNSSYNNTVSGTISGCNYGLNSSYNNTVSGTISGCNYDTIIYNCRNSYYNAVHSTSPSLNGRNTTGGQGRLICTNMNRVPNAHKIFDNFGDVLQTLCTGIGNAPSVDANGGNGYCREASNIQSNCGNTPTSGAPRDYLRIIDNQRIWLRAGTYTISYKLQTTFVAGISSGNIRLSAQYIGTNNIIATAISETTAVTTRASAADWTQSISVTFTQAIDGYVYFNLDLLQYESGNEVYVWPVPYGTGYSGLTVRWTDDIIEDAVLLSSGISRARIVNGV